MNINIAPNSFLQLAQSPWLSLLGLKRVVLKECPDDFRVSERQVITGLEADVGEGNGDGGKCELNDDDITFSSTDKDGDDNYSASTDFHDEDCARAERYLQEMQQIIGDETLRVRIADLNDSTRFRVVSSASVPSAPASETIRIHPLPDDKESRVSIHEWVLLPHPFLRTKFSDGAILVIPDVSLERLAPAGLSAADVQTLAEFLRRGPSSSQASSGVMLARGMVREARSAVYTALARACTSLEFKTVETSVSNEKAILATFRKKTQKRALAKASLTASAHIQFVMRKNNVEHFAAMAILRKAVGGERADGTSISVAGIKDKRALTHQFCTVTVRRSLADKKGRDQSSGDGGRAVLAEELRLASQDVVSRLLSVNLNVSTSSSSSSSIDANIRIGRFSFVPQALQLGALAGNRFSIVMRGLPPHSIEHLRERREKLKESGFPNYFGQQRMGEAIDSEGGGGGEGDRNGETPSAALPLGCRIGRVLLLGDHVATAREILLGSTHPDAAEYQRQLIAGASADALLAAMPTRSSGLDKERLLVRALMRFGCEAALMSSQVQVGVAEDQLAAYRQALHQIPFSLRLLWINAFQSWLWNGAASSRISQGNGSEPLEGDLILAEEESSCAEAEADAADVQVRLLTSEEISGAREHGPAQLAALSRRVVMPLFGSRVSYPVHASGRAYHDLLQRAGLLAAKAPATSGNFSKSPPLHAFPKGAYRRLFQSVGELELHEVPGQASAVLSTFTLPPGSFATVFLRELCASDSLLLT